MAVRAVLVFFISLGYIRLANKRIFGQHSAFDIVLGVMYGSIMSRSVTGNSPFFPTLLAGLVLVVLHRFLASLAYQSGQGQGISNLIKGRTFTLAKDGKLIREVMQANSITENDLVESMRSQGGPTDITKIETACLERNGKISIIFKQEEK
ncbi:DUF421 domain-containing protein [Rufibacter glacialis]|nr:DUF421 domain-containing protein [Rufibacter glacialis]